MAATGHIAQMLALSSEKGSIVTLGNEGSAERRRGNRDQPSQGSATNKRYYSSIININSLFRQRAEGKRIKDSIIKWMRDKEQQSSMDGNMIYIPEEGKPEPNSICFEEEEENQDSQENANETMIVNESNNSNR